MSAFCQHPGMHQFPITQCHNQVFEPLKETIIQSVPLPCNYAIPPPPGLERLDPEKVNVQYLPPAGAEQLFPRADGFEQCADNLAWYYDEPSAPTEVLLCEQACNTVAAGGTINITFGCQIPSAGKSMHFVSTP